jgi:hypothetical protein
MPGIEDRIARIERELVDVTAALAVIGERFRDVVDVAEMLKSGAEISERQLAAQERQVVALERIAYGCHHE